MVIVHLVPPAAISSRQLHPRPASCNLVHSLPLIGTIDFNELTRAMRKNDLRIEVNAIASPLAFLGYIASVVAFPILAKQH